ncbi:MAG: NPCBM/NEW2 domain-containing protein [Planctomycetaceae bacterium]|nr:NPCBM/NEW2 domain-containing protein [Planctomycetaceae bacterium]
MLIDRGRNSSWCGKDSPKHKGLSWWGLLLWCCFPVSVSAGELPQCTVFRWDGQAGKSTRLQELSGVDNLRFEADVVTGTQGAEQVRLLRKDIWRIEWRLPGREHPHPGKGQQLQVGRDDRWTFESIAFQDDAFQVFHRPGKPPVSFSLEHVPAVFWSQPRYGLPFPGERSETSVLADRLLLKNGDQLQGTLGALDKSGLTMQAEFGDLVLPLSQLRELRLNPLLLSPPEIPETAVIVALHDETVLTAGDVRIAQNSHALEVTLPGGQAMEWSLAEVRSLTFCSPATRPLTWLPVLEATQESYLGRRSPILQGAAATGTPIVVQGKTYPLGLGVRSGSRVTVQLPVGAQEFWCVVGLDEVALGRGMVTIQVKGASATGEDRELFPETLLSAANSPLLLGPLAVRELDTLTLQTNYGPQADILDVIDWCLPTVRVAQSP